MGHSAQRINTTVRPIVLNVLYALAQMELGRQARLLRPAFSNLYGVVLRG